MNGKKLALFSILTLIVLQAMFPFVLANPQPATTQVRIFFPTDAIDSRLHYSYQNSTVNLTITVTYVKEGPAEPPKVNFISYSIDEQPLVYLRNLTVNKWYYSPFDQDITSYRTSIIVEGLTEGNHTIYAYANDLSTYRTFPVDSHYVVPVLTILSPTNQTYTDTVPLTFTVNTNFSAASYLMWDWKKMDTHYNGELSENCTLENLPSGDYIIKVFATGEKGDYLSATAYFSLSHFPLLERTPPEFLFMFILFVLTLASTVLVYFKWRRSKVVASFSILL
ncbi:MAG: hypothetical protein NWE92_13665 [Candidatus Bathyarchaeota archaeon]|nr:hypothetical protein [Candidatus Bathyarchaeota archaeon]